MTSQLTSPIPEHPAKKWVSIVLLAALAGYAASPPMSVGLAMLEDGGLPSPVGIMPAILGVQAATCVAALVWLAREADFWTRISKGLRLAGWLLVAALAALVVLTIKNAMTDTSPDQGAATASFFMLIIFGGYYGIQGLILLIAGHWAKRRAAKP